MEDLQNRFDQQGAPDFDREALWQRIEQPRKRWRMHWWWLGAGCMVLLLWVGLSRETTAPALSGFYIGDVGSWQKEDLPASPVEALKQAIPHKDDASVAGTSREQGSQTDAARKASSVKDKPSRKRLFAIKVAPSDTSLQPLSGAKLPSEAPDLTMVANKAKVVINPSSEPVVSNADSLAGTVKKQLKELANRKALKPLPALPVALIFSEPFTEFPTLLAEPEASRLHKSTFAIFSGLATQLHTANTDCDRAGEERAQPGFFLRGQYQRSIGKGFYAFASAQYTAHRAQVRAQHATSARTLNTLNEEVRTVETTYYELYHQYDRVELGLGVGRSWTVGALAFSLGASAGYSHWLRIDGNYVDQERVLQSLSPAAEVPGSWAGRLDLSVWKPLPRRWVIGLALNAQTPVLVFQNGRGCEGRIYPAGFGVVAGRRF